MFCVRNVFTNNTKRGLLIVLSIVYVSFFVSCNNDLEIENAYENASMTRCTSWEIDKCYRIIADCNVCLKDDQITMISRKKALRDGVNEKDYDVLKQSIDQANLLLSKIVNDLKSQGYEVEVYDMSVDSNIDIASYVENLTYTETKPMPKGVIETSDGTLKSEVHFAPIQQTGVMANCIAHVALMPLHTVTTTYAGGNAKVGTAFGPGNKTINVPISMSNTNFGISYCTSDSNGGKCVWEGTSEK